MKRNNQQSFANIGLILDGVEVATLAVFCIHLMTNELKMMKI